MQTRSRSGNGARTSTRTSNNPPSDTRTANNPTSDDPRTTNPPTSTARSSPPATPAAAARPAERPAEKPPERQTPRLKAAPQPVEKAAQKQSQKPVEFRLNLPGVKSATLAGSFNDWDSTRTPLAKDPNGGWKTTVLLPPGRYEYRFVIDGGQWFSDPGAKESVPNAFGSTNS